MKLRQTLCPIMMSLAALVRAAEPPVNEPPAVGPAVPPMIEVQVDFIEYKMDVVEKLAQSDKLTAPALLALWREGGGKLICTPRVVTKNSQEAVIKGVTEYIYPTEFKVATPSSTNEPRPAVTAAALEPSGFEMREVGVILQCVPEIGPDGNAIHVMLNPQMVYPPVWKNYGSTHEAADGRKEALPMEQPFFAVHSLSTSVSVANGATVLIGGGMNNPDGDKTVFAFLTARLLDTEGNRIQAAERTGGIEP